MAHRESDVVVSWPLHGGGGRRPGKMIVRDIQSSSRSLIEVEREGCTGEGAQHGRTS